MLRDRQHTLSRIAGVLIAIALPAYIFYRIRIQYTGIAAITEHLVAQRGLLATTVLLAVVNVLLEALRWQQLAGHVSATTYRRAAGSYLTGIACSVFTPGGLGDYPGRVLFLNPSSTGKLRYTGVALLGMMAQYLTVVGLGIVAICGLAVPAPLHKVLIVALPVTALILWVFMDTTRVVRWMSGWALLRKLSRYRELTERIPPGLRIRIIVLTLVRFAVYNAQFLLLLRGYGVGCSLWHGALVTTTFFMIMTLLPSFALAEVGIRGGVALFLFRGLTADPVGVVAASTLLWLCNVILPALPGALLLAGLGFRKTILGKPFE